MEKKLIPAPIDEKNIMSDFINDFMLDWNDYTNGHHRAVIGAPLESDEPYMCEWNNQQNWVRLTPIHTLASKTTLADMQRLADEFMKYANDECTSSLALVPSVSKTQVYIYFYFINE